MRSELAEQYLCFVQDYQRGLPRQRRRVRSRDCRIFWLRTLRGESTSQLARHFEVADAVVSQACARVRLAFAAWLTQHDPDGWGARLDPGATGER